MCVYVCVRVSVCVRVCACVRGIVCELCTCMCVMISLTWHHTNISNIILITVINKLKNKKNFTYVVYSKPYMLHVALSALIGVNWFVSNPSIYYLCMYLPHGA